MPHEIESVVQIPHPPEDPDHEIPFPGTAKVSNASGIPVGTLKLRFFTLQSTPFIVDTVWTSG